MVNAFKRRGATVKVVTDRPEEWPPHDVLAELVHGNDLEPLRDRVADAVTQGVRVLVDCDMSTAEPSLLGQCEHLLWLFDNHDQGLVESRLGTFVRDRDRLAGHSQVVWTHQRSFRLPRHASHDLPLPGNDMRVQWDEDSGELAFRQHDVSRCMHCVDDLQFGLALGGGGAKGVAHLGVIEVLNREGIYFDSVAGTSAGAIMSAGYAMGKSPDVLLQLMLKEMTPPGWLRKLPKSREMFLLSQFRMGWIEPKFREHLQNVQFDELLLPTSLVTVDLVTGQERIRRSGDVVSSVMESINHPIFGKPILRGDEALVDGGVLANVPSHCLRRQGANFVLAVDVTTKLSADFCRDPRRPERLTSPGYLRTLLRVNDVSLRSLSGIHRSGSDYVITPDTSAHTFDDFAAGEELMNLGRAAAEAALPEIKERVAKVYCSIDESASR
jgi:predicted acylesterase/phospholipase RssA